MTRAFISAPFRHKDRAQIEQNIRNAVEYATLLKMMVNHIDPVVVHTEIASRWGIDVANSYGSTADKEIVQYNLSELKTCKIVYVCGPQITHGMQEEIDVARGWGLPIVRVEESFLEMARQILEQSPYQI